jgi:hypothetical protein
MHSRSWIVARVAQPLLAVRFSTRVVERRWNDMHKTAQPRVAVLLGVKRDEGFAGQGMGALLAFAFLPRRVGGRTKTRGRFFRVAELLLNISREQKENAIARILGDERCGGLFSARVIAIVIAQAFGHVEARFERGQFAFRGGDFELAQALALVTAGDAHEKS